MVKIRLHDFSSRIILRIGFLVLSILGITAMIRYPNMVFAAILVGLIIVFQIWELIRFATQTNRKLTRFLESVKYSDFISGFTTDHKLGKSFRDLNEAFNEVLEAFRKTRSEREEHWQYLNTVVQQVRTGIISYDSVGQIQLINTNARKLIGSNHLKSIHELKQLNPRFYEALMSLEPGRGELFRGGIGISLALQSTEMRIRGMDITLVTLQNIQSELQQQELESWQNLTKVLRHEIMNSITPISSLTSTLRDILKQDLTYNTDHFEMGNETADDLIEGLATIENRSRSLIRFIDAYREYTSLPKPELKSIRLKDLIDKVAGFMKTELNKTNILFSYTCESEYLVLNADYEMIEQVLINLMKNAIEALAETPQPHLELRGYYAEGSIRIEVTDNGPGIIQEALENIFVPFYSTKRTGSGIGLSLSRQIMQLHNGTISVESTPEVSTTFTLRF